MEALMARSSPSYPRFPFTAQIALGLIATSVSAYLALLYGSPDLLTFLAGAAAMFLLTMIVMVLPKKALPLVRLRWPRWFRRGA